MVLVSNLIASRGGIFFSSLSCILVLGCASWHDTESPHQRAVSRKGAIDCNADSFALLQMHKFDDNKFNQKAEVVTESEATGNALLELKGKLPQDAEWFDSFSNGESTFDESGVLRGQGIVNALDGWEPIAENPYVDSAVSPEFFHESPSGGSNGAWQARFSAPPQGVAGRGDVGKWQQGDSGIRYQEYNRIGARDAGPHNADWFDTRVHQLDGFGRQQEPRADTGARYAQGSPRPWVERTVNTTLTCTDPGCSVSVSLQAFEGNSERAKHCSFKFDVTATDYDSPDEQFEWISINGVRVNTGCNIAATGCNATASRPAYPCIDNLRLDTLMPTTGTLVIGAKINNLVDECPYEGNMLHAVPIVTCLVQGKQPPPLYGGTPNSAEAILAAAAAEAAAHRDIISSAIGGSTIVAQGRNVAVSQVDSDGQSELTNIFRNTQRSEAFRLAAREIVTPTWHFLQAPLKCPQRGCTARLSMDLNRTAAAMGTCAMTIIVNQTDFDGDHGSDEGINYISIGSENVTVADPSPGVNPCMARWSGSPVPNDQLEWAAVSDVDVTQKVQAGEVIVQARISNLVDECPSQGFLLDALVQVNCTNQGLANLEQLAAEDLSTDTADIDAGAADTSVADAQTAGVETNAETADAATAGSDGSDAAGPAEGQ